MPENSPLFSQVTVSDINGIMSIYNSGSHGDLSGILSHIRSMPKAKQQEFNRLFPQFNGAMALLESGIEAVSNFDPIEYKPFGAPK